MAYKRQADGAESTINDVLVVIRDLSLMVSDGFTEVNDQLEDLRQRDDESRVILNEHSDTLRDHSAQLTRLRLTTDKILDIQETHTNDIMAIYELLEKLDAKLEISEEERKDAALRLRRVITWAHRVAKHLDIPLDSEPTKRNSTIA